MGHLLEDLGRLVAGRLSENAPDKESRIRLMAQRWASGRNIFTGDLLFGKDFEEWEKWRRQEDNKQHSQGAQPVAQGA